MWARLKRLFRRAPLVDPAFHDRMRAARAYGIQQSRASRQAQRQLRQASTTERGGNPITDSMFPPQKGRQP